MKFKLTMASERVLKKTMDEGSAAKYAGLVIENCEFINDDSSLYFGHWRLPDGGIVLGSEIYMAQEEAE